MKWQQRLADILPLMGHRNWIVVTDAAYPAQAQPGIETIVANDELIAVLESVLAQVSGATHVRPVVHVDAELQFVAEQDAPGVSEFRRRLTAALGELAVESLPHEAIIERLDEAARTFRILVIKTNETIPYTSVFLRLECGYWTDDAERRLRETITH